MFKQCLGIIFLLFSMNTYSANTPLPDEVPLKVNMSYIQRDEKGNDTQQLIEHTLRVNPYNHNWFTLNDLPNDQKSPPVILLAKVEKASAEQITLQFLVLNIIDFKPNIISEPKLTTLYGQEGGMDINIAKGNHIQLKIIAG